MDEVVCSLCQRLERRREDGEFLFDADKVSLFRGPFWDRWPGAVMAVHREHCLELSEARSIALVQQEILLAERAVRGVTGARRMNVVKFGNVCEHLHWHLIPRYAHETQSLRTPWELLEMRSASLYEGDLPDVKGDALLEALSREMDNPPAHFYASALFLRPRGIPGENDCRAQDLEWTISAARENPGNWECLLMRRNYARFEWDTYGGCADAGEFPEITLRREIEEELGWKLSSCREVTRQWRRGVLRGFVFVCIPEDRCIISEGRTGNANAEVAESRYFSLLDIRDNPMFPEKLRGRMRAFLEGRSDF